MFPLFKREAPGIGLVYFESAAPPPAEAFGFIRSAGVEIRAVEPREGTLWTLALSHPVLGPATVMLDRKAPPVGEFLQFGLGLLPGEIERAKTAGSCVVVVVPAERKNVLRDRKRLLRYMQLLMAEDAVLAVDLASGMPWSRAALGDELAHDADLDVEALYVFHAVQDEKDGCVRWLHTHGLAELGGFDFDILRPNEYVAGNANDPFRALTFAMLQGRIAPSTPRFELIVPGGAVGLVPASEFMKRASAEDRAIRTMPDRSHDEKRSVVCEPIGRSLPFQSARPTPARILSEGSPDDLMLAFDAEATALMADRARGTLALLRCDLEEFRQLGAHALVKLGFERARASTSEYLWFEVHGIDGSSIDCTLINEPWDVPSLHEGMRGRHGLERLTDWIVYTPAGAITPRSSLAGRRLRSLPPDELMELVAHDRDQGTAS